VQTRQIKLKSYVSDVCNLSTPVNQAQPISVQGTEHHISPHIGMYEIFSDE
jgi:hypothetical protein